MQLRTQVRIAEHERLQSLFKKSMGYLQRVRVIVCACVIREYACIYCVYTRVYVCACACVTCQMRVGLL